MDIRTEILLKLKINDFIYLVRYKLFKLTLNINNNGKE